MNNGAMKISKNDALLWFDHFAGRDEDAEVSVRDQEIAYAVVAQIEAAVDQRHNALIAKIKNLKHLEHRTLYVGNPDKFPGGCKSCLLGSGMGAIRKTNTCNVRCKFCYNYGEMDKIPPVGEGMWEIGGTRFYAKDLDLLLSIQQKPSGVSYVFLEPFMEIEKYYPIIKKFRPTGIHQHLYTNGLLANESNLRALGEAGLDELRFNLGAAKCADQVIENIRIAKKYIPSVGIETPMTPEFYAGFRKKKAAILATGLDFMNCAELHLNPNNIDNYAGENLYMCRQGYISPLWSRELTLQLMKQADDEAWDLAVHDCSNHTKFARGLNLGAKEGKHFGASSSYACEFPVLPFEAFFPVLNDEDFPFLCEEELPPAYRPPLLEY